MSTVSDVMSTIDRFPRGHVFTYGDVEKDARKKEAVIKALNRMAAAGKIAKLSKGRFYKPESTPFGDLQPDRGQIVKDLLEENGKIIGYLTGLSIYNQLGLTTQVSNTLQIGKNQIRPSFKRERYTITLIQQRNTITRENVPLLQILDAVRYIKKIPDTTIEASCKRLLAILRRLDDKEQTSLVRLAQKYPPATRALLGALLDRKRKTELVDRLFRSLNPITKYKLAGAGIALPTAEKWNIVLA